MRSPITQTKAASTWTTIQQLANEPGGLPPNLSKDGVHPTKAGYDIMGPLAEKAIAAALNQN